MKVQFLGTGAGLPSKLRNTQSLVFNFMQDLKECWMFDCGEATQHQIMNTAIKPSKINKIFISHLHGDHILGLIGFLSSRSFLLNKEELPLTIFGPKGIKEFVEFNINITKSVLGYNVNYVEFENDKIIFENDKVCVEVFSLEHTIESYGFKIKFNSKKGALKVDKLCELGIMPSPLYRTIKEQDTFVFENKTYNSADFLEEDILGKTITVINDTVYFEELNNILQGTNILITECTYLKEEELHLAKKHKHLNISDIYNFSNQVQFDKIYLTHISSRYDSYEIKNIKDNILLDNIEIVQDLDEHSL